MFLLFDIALVVVAVAAVVAIVVGVAVTAAAVVFIVAAVAVAAVVAIVIVAETTAAVVAVVAVVVTARIKPSVFSCVVPRPSQALDLVEPEINQREDNHFISYTTRRYSLQAMLVLKENKT